MTSLDIFKYKGAQVRVVLIDGEPWFVLADLATILDITSVARLASRLDEGVRQTHPLQTVGGTQQMTVVSEPGMYEVVIRSDKPEAVAFRRWITGEVLPMIRKTGSYGTPAIPDISTPEGILALAQQFTRTAEELVAAKHEVSELTPRAEAWDELASATGDYEVADAAKMLARAGVETGRQRLFGQLKDLGWIYRAPSGKWKARQSAVDAGYLAEKPQSHHHPRTGDLVLDPPQVRVTVRGLERLRVRLGRVVALAVA